MSTHRSFRSAMTWLHTWSGLLLGWVLYAIFITGTATYFRPEITEWMQPETAIVAAPAEVARSAFKRLQEVAPESKRWLVSMPDDRSHELKIYWEDSTQSGKRFKSEGVDPSGGKGLAPRATLGGEFFYRFHFQLMLPHPWGRFLACAAALFMLVALISGIVTHRRFFKDLFLLRLGRDGRRPWLDFHNVTATLALPFYLLISYSALVIFTPMLMPLATKFLVPAKAAPAAASMENGPPGPSHIARPDTASWITPDTFERMLAHVENTWDSGRSIKRIEISHRGTPQATASFTRTATPSVSYVFTDRETLTFSGLTGLPLDNPALPAKSLGTRIRGVFYGLHLAHFAGPALRTLFFLMGTMGAAMVGTGLVLWTLKRKDRLTASGRGGRFGYGLVSRLNITTITGLPIACAGFLWANRLIPVTQTDRAELETTGFLIVWGAAALHACLRPAKLAWKEQFIVAAFAFGALPVVDLLTAGRQLDTWPRVDGVYLGCTVTFLLLGALFGYGASKLARRTSP
jgi:uncharacterized iron-regulated membrane protein